MVVALIDTRSMASPRISAIRARIATSLGFTSSAEFLTRLHELRQRVHKRFGEAISLPIQSTSTSLSADGAVSAFSTARDSEQRADDAHAQAAATWQMLTGPNRESILESAKPSAISVELWQALIGFADSAAVQSSSARGRSRMDKVVPMLWALALKQPCSSAKIEACALRLIAFLQAIAGRSAYLALLAEKPSVAERLVQLFTQSAWLAQLITSTPMLMDELLDTRRLTLPHDLPSLQREAENELAGGDSEDIEHAFEQLIGFKHSVQLRLAVGFLQNRLSALSTVNGLSDLADVLIAHVVGFAWRELARVHGIPSGCSASGVGFAVLGGVFAEGVDLPGSLLIGAFIATLGLPPVSVTQDHIQARLDKLFGADHGYADRVPAMQKVVQAAGRVLRTPQDRGWLWLLDERYGRCDVAALLPAWWGI